MPGLDDTLETLGWKTGTEMNRAIRPLRGGTARHADGQLTVTMPGGTWYAGPLPPLADVPDRFVPPGPLPWLHHERGWYSVMPAGQGFFMNAECVRYTAVPFAG